jgi:hypothetical protein
MHLVVYSLDTAHCINDSNSEARGGIVTIVQGSPCPQPFEKGDNAVNDMWIDTLVSYSFAYCDAVRRSTGIADGEDPLQR